MWNWGQWGSPATPSNYMRRMTLPYQSGAGRTLFQYQWIGHLVIWVLIVILLIGLIRWIWRKGDKK